MRERDKPAMETKALSKTGRTLEYMPGLSKFQATAIAAMQGLHANPDALQEAEKEVNDGRAMGIAAALAKASVQSADALWDEIERREDEGA